nr:beta-glucosidase [uncultured bacterium]
MVEATKSLIEQLTLEEKAALCVGITAWDTVPIERLGIPTVTVSDGPHGLRRVPDMAGDSLPATCFPTASALAASWDVDLIAEQGRALADECIAIGVDVLLGPGINMKRTPLCGRNFEYFSEDPFLAGELAASFINAVQDKGVGTSLKHFAVNNQETHRMSISADVDARTLHEIYLAGFERAVKKANPWTVMCGYNRINGIHCSENRWLLTDVLKREWGYDGVAVSDWGAVHDRVKGVAAGLDLEMPGPQPMRVQRIVEAVQNGILDEAQLDDSVNRLLTLIQRASAVPKGGGSVDVDKHHALARKVAAETIVLLKNEGDILPLGPADVIAVVGASAQQPHFQGGGSSHINATRVDIPMDELRQQAPDAEFVYAPGYTMEEGFDQAMIDEAVKIATGADVALLYIALPPFKESEGYDRPDIDLSDQQVALIKAVSAVQPRSIVILNHGSAIAMSDWIEDVPAVLEAWMMGQAGAGAITDVLFGRVNPSGRVAETFPLRLSDTPAYLNFPGERGHVRYGEGLFIGYRYYDAKQQEVLFPFGFGLSYTTFEMRNLHLSKSTIREGEPVTATVEVTNTGSVAGKETVQVYVRDVSASVVRPIKELKGFAKVSLQPGETKTVTIALEDRAFMFYDPDRKTWIAESGEFEILIGKSAAEIVLRQSMMLESHYTERADLSRFSTYGEWLADPRGSAVLRPQLTALFHTVNTPDGHTVAIVETIPWLLDVPLDAVLGFFGRNERLTSDEVVANLLKQL